MAVAITCCLKHRESRVELIIFACKILKKFRCFKENFHTDYIHQLRWKTHHSVRKSTTPDPSKANKKSTDDLKKLAPATDPLQTEIKIENESDFMLGTIQKKQTSDNTQIEVHRSISLKERSRKATP